jgi:hypothetical protein
MWDSVEEFIFILAGYAGMKNSSSSREFRGHPWSSEDLTYFPSEFDFAQ